MKKDEKASLDNPALALLLDLAASCPSSGDFRGGVGSLLDLLILLLLNFTIHRKKN